jgi:hypothetical protein
MKTELEIMSHILIPSEGLERAYLYLTRNDIPTSITLKLNWQSEPHSVSASLGLNSHCGKFCSRSANLPPLASQRLTGMPHCGSHQAPNAPHPHKHLLVQNEMAPPWICTHVVTHFKTCLCLQMWIADPNSKPHPAIWSCKDSSFWELLTYIISLMEFVALIGCLS